MLKSIAIPSNRDYKKSFTAIQSAINYCNLTRSDLAISDNSSDKDKNLMWRNLDSMHVTEPCGMIDNWYKTFDQTKGDFVLFMGDDDRIVSLNKNELDVTPDVAGIHPAVICFTPEKGIVRAETLEFKGDTALERVKQQIENTKGANTPFFSFWRRDILKSIMDLWFLHHPTKATYCDWAIMNALASSGKLIRDPSSVYFYNITNWIGDAAFIKSQTENAFINSGLPAEATKYLNEFKYIDSFIFIMRKDSPIPYEEKLEAAKYCMEKLDWKTAGEIVSEFGLKEKYEQFYFVSTGKKWGEI